MSIVAVAAAFAGFAAGFVTLPAPCPEAPSCPIVEPCPECPIVEPCPSIAPEPDLEENPCKDAPLVKQLPNVPCNESKAQSPADVTPGLPDDRAGQVDPTIDPIADFNDRGMCTVNVHWHIGAEHRNEDDYSEKHWFKHPDLPPGDHNGQRRELAGDGGLPIEHVGHMCKIAKEGFEAQDPIYTTPYDWKYCKNMYVGLTYEFHWPHSNLGHCNTKWQYQYPFMDGVLCDATVGDVDLATAAELIFTTEAVKFGVEGQVFTIVNTVGNERHSEYAYPTWDIMAGWNRKLAGDDYAVYKGSTTGAGADNEFCRGTGGMVTWHQDRTCHPIEAATVDNLCRMMLVLPADDLSPDVEPHGSRDTVLPAFTDNPDDNTRRA